MTPGVIGLVFGLVVGAVLGFMVGHSLKIYRQTQEYAAAMSSTRKRQPIDVMTYGRDSDVGWGDAVGVAPVEIARAGDDLDRARARRRLRDRGA